MKTRKQNTLWSFMKKVDIFGIPVSLTHKGNENFHTSFGTAMTYLFLIIILAKGLNDFSNIWNGEILNITT